MGKTSQLNRIVYRRPAPRGSPSGKSTPISPFPSRIPAPKRKKMGASQRRSTPMAKPLLWPMTSACTIWSSGVKLKPLSFSGEMSSIHCHQTMGR